MKTESDLSVALAAGESDPVSWFSFETYKPPRASVADVPK